MNLYIMRHGRTLWNELGILQGNLDSELTAEAEKEIKNIRKFFSDSKIFFDRVITSPSKRAKSTAELLGFQMIEESEFFKELGMGNLQGLSYDIFEGEFPEEYNNYFNNPIKYNPEIFQGENFNSLFERIEIGLRSLVDKQNRDKNILLITHGVTIQGILSYIIYGNIDSLPKIPAPKNLEIFTLENENGKFEIRENMIKK